MAPTTQPLNRQPEATGIAAVMMPVGSPLPATRFTPRCPNEASRANGVRDRFARPSRRDVRSTEMRLITAPCLPALRRARVPPSVPLDCRMSFLAGNKMLVRSSTARRPHVLATFRPLVRLSAVGTSTRNAPRCEAIMRRRRSVELRRRTMFATARTEFRARLGLQSRAPIRRACTTVCLPALPAGRCQAVVRPAISVEKLRCRRQVTTAWGATPQGVLWHVGRRTATRSGREG